MKRRKRCMKGCESDTGCKLLFKFRDIVKGAGYRDTGEELEDKALSDFNDAYDEVILAKIQEQRRTSVDHIIGNVVKCGEIYKINSVENMNYFARKWNVRPETLYADVIQTDEEYLGDIWVEKQESPVVVEYGDRISEPNCTIPFIGRVYFCSILTNQGMETDFRTLDSGLLHKIEINDRERLI